MKGNDKMGFDRSFKGGSPQYKVDRKLGKGGFGQVFIGRRGCVYGGTDCISAILVPWS
ncbi:hypothetical protein HanHA300_Chr17g0659311 [Helianthus annuus]|nr:hypothetical protein HanHA300_Chr17g0659311 [Helianthus annuus]KAJ0448001.1 hypothetical protein HanHA89_Chr17g0711761 [Helianthus annuus]KAJ0632894.1 hypothetical protein HanLR1_Chr17g0670331 [Helianthus annuus]